MPAFFGQVVGIISTAVTPEEVDAAKSQLSHIIIFLLIIFGVGGIFTWIRGAYSCPPYVQV